MKLYGQVKGKAYRNIQPLARKTKRKGKKLLAFCPACKEYKPVKEFEDNDLCQKCRQGEKK